MRKNGVSMGRLVGWVLLTLSVGCQPRATTERETPAASSSAKEHGFKLLSLAPSQVAITSVVAQQLARARSANRDLLIYVGAPWCEPCTRFHQAAAAGELDQAFPRLTILEFDHDRDQKRLAFAGCRSQLIPLFALPTEDGRCDPKGRITGSVKGPGAVANITPRLQKLLGR